MKLATPTTTEDLERAQWFRSREAALGAAQLIFNLVNLDAQEHTDVRVAGSGDADDLWWVELETEGTNEVNYLEDPELP